MSHKNKKASPRSARHEDKAKLILAEYQAAKSILACLSSPFPDNEEAIKRLAQEELVLRLKYRLFTLGALSVEDSGTTYPLTFELSPDGKSIKCKRCKRVSYNQGDIEHHYCAHCKMFHDDIWPPAREWWITSYSE